MVIIKKFNYFLDFLMNFKKSLNTITKLLQISSICFKNVVWKEIIQLKLRH